MVTGPFLCALVVVLFIEAQLSAQAWVQKSQRAAALNVLAKSAAPVVIRARRRRGAFILQRGSAGVVAPERAPGCIKLCLWFSFVLQSVCETRRASRYSVGVILACS